MYRIIIRDGDDPNSEIISATIVESIHAIKKAISIEIRRMKEFNRELSEENQALEKSQE